MRGGGAEESNFNFPFLVIIRVIAGLHSVRPNGTIRGHCATYPHSPGQGATQFQAVLPQLGRQHVGGKERRVMIAC